MTTQDTRKTRRRPGRRPHYGRDRDDIRERLLQAARQAFARQGFRGTTLRQIADAANASPAMIHYHFKDKHGLYHAMLEATVGPMLVRLQGIATAGSSEPLVDALRNYMALVASTPELPALLIRDVLSQDGAMRDTFIRDFASRGAASMGRIVEADRKTGKLRDDLDQRLALLSLMSMAIFPFLAQPVAERALGLEYDDTIVERLAVHVARLFQDGTRKREETP